METITRCFSRTFTEQTFKTMIGYISFVIFYFFIIINNHNGYCQISNEMCGESGLCHHPNRTIYTHITCYCEKDQCWRYGDCCRDVQSIVTPVKQIETSCQSIKPKDQTVYIVNTCPSIWKEETIRSLCSKNISHDEEYNYLLDIPFLSNETNILYGNLFCAKCNNDYSSPNQLKVTLSCKSTISMFCQNLDLIKSSTYMRGELWWRPLTNSLASIQLKIDLKNVRKCRKVIDECATNWTDHVTKNLCKSYSNYVEVDKSTVFKNFHCAQCNFQNVSELKCASKVKERVQFTFRTISVLLNFEMENDMCESNEIFDPVSQKCYAFMCGTAYKRLKGKCIRIDKGVFIKDTLHKASNATIISCPVIPVSSDELEFFSNGSVLHNQTLKMYNPGEYEQVNSSIYYVCYFKVEFLVARTFPVAQSILSTVCMVLSLICLVINVAIRCLTQDLKKVPEKNLISLSVSLFIAQFLFSLGVDKTDNYEVCYAVGVLIHFFYLNVFAWVSIMAFDISFTLSKFYTKIHEGCTFYFYFAFALLFPIVIVTVSLIADQTELMPFLQPNYGKELCWISHKFSLFIFFALPLAILLVFNCVCFFKTVYTIRKSEKVTRNIRKSCDHKRFWLYVKLAIIMGGTWIFGFAANLTSIEPLWYIFVILNASQGTILFVLFTCKRDILSRLSNKVGSSKNVKTRKSTPTMQSALDSEEIAMLTNNDKS